MYKVQQLYLETQEASDLGTFVTMPEAKDCMAEAIELAYDQEQGLGCEDVRKKTDAARRRGCHHCRDCNGSVSSWFAISEGDND